MSIKQDSNLDPRLYTGLQGLTTQPFTEANVKNGSQFYISEIFEIPSGGNPTNLKYFVFETGDADVIVKFRNIRTNGGQEYTVFRGATVSGGELIPIYNLNDKFPNGNVMTVSADPTVTDEGTKWDSVKSFNQQGQQSGGGVFGTSGAERILQKNTEYLVKFENTDNFNVGVSYIVSWYEGPLSVDIV